MQNYSFEQNHIFALLSNYNSHVRSWNMNSKNVVKNGIYKEPLSDTFNAQHIFLHKNALFSKNIEVGNYKKVVIEPLQKTYARGFKIVIIKIAVCRSQDMTELFQGLQYMFSFIC